MASKKKFEVRDLTADDGIDLDSIIASGGLSGHLMDVLRTMDLEGGNVKPGEVIAAITSLIVGALSNPNTADRIRGWLYNVWISDEDKKQDAERDDYGTLVGDSDKKKMIEWRKLPMGAENRLLKTVLSKKEFKEDFLGSWRELLSTQVSSLQSATNSSEPTDIQTKK